MKAEKIISALSRVIDEAQLEDREQRDEQREAKYEEEREKEATREGRMLVALERIAYSFQRISEDFSAIRCNGINLHK